MAGRLAFPILTPSLKYPRNTHRVIVGADAAHDLPIDLVLFILVIKVIIVIIVFPFGSSSSSPAREIFYADRFDIDFHFIVNVFLSKSVNTSSPTYRSHRHQVTVKAVDLMGIKRFDKFDVVIG